jgi:hypothetical protein
MQLINKIPAKEQANLLLLASCYNKSTYTSERGTYVMGGMESAIFTTKYILTNVDPFLPKEISDYWAEVLVELELIKNTGVEKPDKVVKDSAYDDQA